ncbi:MAG: hypothetical protein J7J98_05180 [candidate division Zixibacteria bacterium]|nr:hypothetical protein [candidate division Zixibacteria bacterium]
MSKLTFRASNDEPELFGYVPPDHTGPGIGVKSITLYGRYAYVTDEVHGNIKRINLTTSHVEVSPALYTPARLAWPADIAMMKSLIYVASRVGRLYILDDDLSVLATKELLHDNEPVFIPVSDSSLTLFYDGYNTMWIIHSPDSIVLHRDTAFEIDYWNAPRGKMYKVEDSIQPNTFETDSYSVQLKGVFPGNDAGLDAFNVDFNDSTLVYYDIDASELVITVYKRGWE